MIWGQLLLPLWWWRRWRELLKTIWLKWLTHIWTHFSLLIIQAEESVMQKCLLQTLFISTLSLLIPQPDLCLLIFLCIQYFAASYSCWETRHSFSSWTNRTQRVLVNNILSDLLNTGSPLLFILDPDDCRSTLFHYLCFQAFHSSMVQLSRNLSNGATTPVWN